MDEQSRLMIRESDPRDLHRYIQCNNGHVMFLCAGEIVRPYYRHYPGTTCLPIKTQESIIHEVWRIDYMDN